MPKKVYAKKYYTASGDLVPGVTTVIKTNLGWGKDALIGWAVKVTKEGKDFREIAKGAADAGTLAHAKVERFIRESLGLPPFDFDENAYTEEQQAAAQNAFSAFMLWLNGSNLTIVASEVEIVSERYRYGGTIDIILKDAEGNFHIADVKTSNYLLPDHAIQVAAYAYAFAEKETNDTVGPGHVLRFNKGNAPTFHHTYWSPSALAYGMESFKALLQLHSVKKLVDDII